MKLTVDSDFASVRPKRGIPNVLIPMRDDVRLSADVYAPAERGPVPVLLHRTPYGKQSPLHVKWARYFAANGFVVVVQDLRGRWESEGEWDPFFNEGRDGADTIDWIAQQAWCDGSLAMYGGSYAGWVQWAAARERPAALRALASTAPMGRWFQAADPYLHGILTLQFLMWVNLVGGRTNQDNSLIHWGEVFEHLPLRTIDQVINRPSQVWQDWLDHSTLDQYWSEIRLDDDFPRIDLPVLHITGWYDDAQPSTHFFYEGMCSSSPAADEQVLVVGPWDHAGTRVPHRSFGPFDFGEGALLDVLGLHVQWFDRHLRGCLVQRMRKVRYFVMNRNEWRDDYVWPPSESTVKSLYLVNDGTTGLSESPGEPTCDAYTYDPLDPVRVPRNPDRQYQFANAYETRDDDDLERSEIERRPDVLAYETVPIQEELVVAGRTWVELYAESDCVDTDWFVWLADHFPDGRSIVLAQGQLGARFRDSLTEPRPLVPGAVYRFRIELSDVAYAFRPGHRIALVVTSSLFPLFARNPNTGSPLGSDTEVKVARNRIHLGRIHPSRVELPVIPNPAVSDELSS